MTMLNDNLELLKVGRPMAAQDVGNDGETVLDISRQKMVLCGR
jgi:hypothetical protein